MDIIYTLEDIPPKILSNRSIITYWNSIFLAGPTPRDAETKSWRPEAIKILEDINFDGTIFYPEFNPEKKVIFDDEVEMYEWEHKALNECSVIVFWVPRNLEKMPALTTNIECGRFFHLPKSIYGRPNDSPKNNYLDWYYKKCRKGKPYNNLKDLFVFAVDISKKFLKGMIENNLQGECR